MSQPENIVTPEGFEHLLVANEPRLRRIARSYGGIDWEDLLQEIHLQLWRGRERFRGDAKASTWLYRVAVNTALSYCRGKKIQTVPLDPHREPGSAGQPVEPTELLRDFLDQLNAANRAVLLLYLEGLSHGEIAEVIGTTVGSVATRLSRLKQQFEQTYVEEPA